MSPWFFLCSSSYSLIATLMPRFDLISTFVSAMERASFALAFVGLVRQSVLALHCYNGPYNELYGHFEAEAVECLANETACGVTISTLTVHSDAVFDVIETYCSFDIPDSELSCTDAVHGEIWNTQDCLCTGDLCNLPTSFTSKDSGLMRCLDGYIEDVDDSLVKNYLGTATCLPGVGKCSIYSLQGGMWEFNGRVIVAHCCEEDYCQTLDGCSQYELADGTMEECICDTETCNSPALLQLNIDPCTENFCIDDWQPATLDKPSSVAITSTTTSRSPDNNNDNSSALTLIIDDVISFVCVFQLIRYLRNEVK